MSSETPPPPPPPQLPPPPPPSGYPQQQYLPPVPTSGKAIAVMVLGIVSIVLSCWYGIGLIPAIVGLSLAPGAKREIAAAMGRLNGAGMVKAGVICSWVGVGISALYVLFFIFIVILAAANPS